MDYELIGLPICPYVQRARIVLLHKRVAHRVTFIDLKSPPAWFAGLSPLGRVPLLRVGDAVLFESAAINEFLDETAPPRLLPADPLARARQRAWIAFASELQATLMQVATAPTEAAFGSARATLAEQLGRVETVLGTGPYFAGTVFSLVDASYAPLFVRLALLEGWAPLDATAGCPRVAAWSTTLIALATVRDSAVGDFPQRFRAHLAAPAGKRPDIRPASLLPVLEVVILQAAFPGSHVESAW